MRQERLFGVESPVAAADNFQSLAHRQGRAVLEEAVEVLRAAGFDVMRSAYEIFVLGVEVNLVLRDRVGGLWYCEVTGAHVSKRPGLRRTDTVRKVLGSAHLLSRGGFKPFVVLTTDLPAPGSRGDRMLRASGPRRLFDVIVLGRPEDLWRLNRYASQGGGTAGPIPGWWSAGEIRDAGLVDELWKAVRNGPDVPAVEGISVKRFRHRVEFVVPTRDFENRKIDRVVRAEFIKDLTAWFSILGGGHGTQVADGGWVGEDGIEIEEHVSVLGCWTQRRVPLKELEPFIRRGLLDLKQEAICVVVDGEMFLASLDGDRISVRDTGEEGSRGTSAS